jgi:transposase InsO family protein
LGEFTPLTARLLYVHIDLVGPLPTSASYTYCLTVVYRFTRWLEVVSIPDITVNTVERALLTGWISHFGCPQTIATEQGRQFELKLFQFLARLCGIQVLRTTAHLPAANGHVERIHRTLKVATMCHSDKQSTEALLLVLLGIRTAFKEDLQASVAELVYGESLRITCELLTPAAEPMDPVHLITELHQHMASLRVVPATRHHSLTTFVHSDLENSMHVFLRQDTRRRALEPTYSCSYQVFS